jgi:hypothetical protein
VRKWLRLLLLGSSLFAYAVAGLGSGVISLLPARSNLRAAGELSSLPDWALTQTSLMLRQKKVVFTGR